VSFFIQNDCTSHATQTQRKQNWHMHVRTCYT